ncbi:agrin-like [Panonychus citri]|uniref:agrin-like n=1 Tax=Panonychus citri TaxID=50023 RepID=UPI0023074BAE|nr:agrin-like [Panonychus citri]
MVKISIKMNICTRKNVLRCLIKSPCESLRCSFRQHCIIDTTGTPLCTCRVCSAHDMNQEIICGSDNKTYFSECDIERSSCLNNLDISIKHRGHCVSPIDRSSIDPCANVVCNYGSVCIPPTFEGENNPKGSPLTLWKRYKDDSTGSPVKPTNSDDSNQHHESTNVNLCQCPYCEDSGSSVCGSDGITYTSQCSLTTASCTEKRYITTRYEGPCHTCSNLTCSHYAVCEIDPETSKPQCVCPKVCIRDDNPVCGSNGRNYESECELQMASCLQKINLTIVHHGSCISSLCKSVDCKTVDEPGKCLEGQSCDCNQFNCQIEPIEPVCGDDGITYANQCELRQSSCRKQFKLSQLYFGTCDQMMISLITTSTITIDPITSPSSSIVNQNSNDINDLLNSANRAKNNHDNHDQVVNSKGADSIGTNDLDNIDSQLESYQTSTSNQHHHHQHHHHHNRHHHSHKQPQSTNDHHPNQITSDPKVTLITTCDNLLCLFGASCQYNSSDYPYCHCSFHCDAEPFQSSPPLPGDPFDESSLSSLPLSGSAAFENDRRLIFVSSLHESICGSDGQYYDNECQMKRESCNQQKDISIVDDKFCEQQSTSVSSQLNTDDNKLLTNSNGTNHETKMKCESSEFGCCLDGQTQALGSDYLGCPERCFCNRRGSIGSNCDPVTRQCRCKPGIGGLKCNRCEADFWGLHMAKGQDGCLPCNCNKFGSVRSDCEQTTGKCVCIPGIKGPKCDICPQGTILGLHGCTHGKFPSFKITGNHMNRLNFSVRKSYKNKQTSYKENTQ